MLKLKRHFNRYYLIYIELIAYDWPEQGESWTGAANTMYILEGSGPSIPYDGFVHSFHAQITTVQAKIRFQIWRTTSTPGTLTLIDQTNMFTTTSSQRSSINSTVSFSTMYRQLQRIFHLIFHFRMIWLIIL